MINGLKSKMAWIEDKAELKGKWVACFIIRGESPGCPLFSTASMLEWLWYFLPHHSQGSSTERWSWNTLRVVTARVFYVLGGSLTSPLIIYNSVETAAPFITWSATHDVVSREMNLWKSFNLMLGSNLWHLACLLLLCFWRGSSGCHLFSTACL